MLSGWIRITGKSSSIALHVRTSTETMRYYCQRSKEEYIPIYLLTKALKFYKLTRFFINSSTFISTIIQQLLNTITINSVYFSDFNWQSIDFTPLWSLAESLGTLQPSSYLAFLLPTFFSRTFMSQNNWGSHNSTGRSGCAYLHQNKTIS